MILFTSIIFALLIFESSYALTEEGAFKLHGNRRNLYAGTSGTCLEPRNAVVYFGFEELAEGPVSGPIIAKNLANPGTDDATSSVWCRSGESKGGSMSAAILGAEACVLEVENPSTALTELGVAAGKEDFSVQFWAKAEAWTGGGNLGLVALASYIDNNANNQWYIGISPGSDNFQLSYRGDGAFKSVRGPNASTCTDGQWCHVAVVIRQTADAVDFFINGAKTTASGDLPSFGLEPATNLRLFIGSNPPFDEDTNDAGAEFRGFIDEVGIYDFVLSDADITALYTNPTSLSCDDSNECTDDECSPTSRLCVHTHNNDDCDDGDVNTINDVCTAGSCSGISAPKKSPKSVSSHSGKGSGTSGTSGSGSGKGIRKK